MYKDWCTFNDVKVESKTLVFSHWLRPEYTRKLTSSRSSKFSCRWKLRFFLMKDYILLKRWHTPWNYAWLCETAVIATQLCPSLWIALLLAIFEVERFLGLIAIWNISNSVFIFLWNKDKVFESLANQGFLTH